MAGVYRAGGTPDTIRSSTNRMPPTRHPAHRLQLPTFRGRVAPHLEQLQEKWEAVFPPELRKKR